MSQQLTEKQKSGEGKRESGFEEGGGGSGGVSTGALCWQLTVQDLYLLDLV